MTGAVRGGQGGSNTRQKGTFINALTRTRIIAQAHTLSHTPSSHTPTLSHFLFVSFSLCVPLSHTHHHTPQTPSAQAMMTSFGSDPFLSCKCVLSRASASEWETLPEAAKVCITMIRHADICRNKEDMK